MSTRTGEVGRDREESESLKLQKELLRDDYLELLTQSRHVETIRMSAVNLALVLTSALAALITIDKAVNRTDLVPSLIITALGIFSTMFSLAYFARYDKYKLRAEVVRKELDRRFFPLEGLCPGMAALREEADNSNRSSEDEPHGVLHEQTLKVARHIAGTTHLFWVLLPLFVAILGIVLTVFSLNGTQAPTQ